MQLPLVQMYADRPSNDCFASWAVEIFPKHAERTPACAESENSLPKARIARERGARESRRLRCLERAPSRELAHANRTLAYPDRAAGRRQACSRARPNVTLLHYARFKCELGRANVLSLSRHVPTQPRGA